MNEMRTKYSVTRLLYLDNAIHVLKKPCSLVYSNDLSVQTWFVQKMTLNRAKIKKYAYHMANFTKSKKKQD